MSLPPDNILLQWMNFHLRRTDYKKIMTNFSSDVKVHESVPHGLPIVLRESTLRLIFSKIKIHLVVSLCLEKVVIPGNCCYYSG